MQNAVGPAGIAPGGMQRNEHIAAGEIREGIDSFQLGLPPCGKRLKFQFDFRRRKLCYAPGRIHPQLRGGLYQLRRAPAQVSALPGIYISA